MPSMGSIEPLQEPINRFARALIVPRRLLALHPRKQGNAGDAAALAPAITLGVIAAFEGFVEEFVAVGAMSRGFGLAHVAKAVGNLNNPDVAAFERLVIGQLGVPNVNIGAGFSIDNWTPPRPNSTWWQVATLDWDAVKKDAEAWMQVRHSLTHGLTSGWRAENWPGPLRSNARPASSVLHQTKTGLHTLVIHGAISCARIYIEAGRHIAAVTAQHFQRTIDVDVIPTFPLYREQAQQQTPSPTQTVEELPEEGDEISPSTGRPAGS